MSKDDFFCRVYEVCRQIPFGKVTTYGLIANALGSPSSSRVVGWALNKSLKVTPPVPAQRVLNRNGMLSGKKAFSGINIMQELLQQEGHVVENDRVVNFEKVLWKPDKFENYY